MKGRIPSRALAGAIVAIAAVPAVALGAPTSALADAGRAAATVRVAGTLAGPVLVDHRGHTVFMFSRERRERDTCAAIHRCLTDWPPVTTTTRPVAGPGVKPSLLATIPYRGARREVTYDGHPLHTYRFDVSPRSVMNIGNMQFGGAWWALNADGRPVK